MIILPSLEIVPAKYNVSTNTLLSQIPIDGTGDFTVTRATTPTADRSTRVNALGFIEAVANNLPRLDYPIGGGCPALLVEPSAQNLCLYSENFGTFPWNPFDVAITGNVTGTLDPAGGNTADQIFETAVSTNHFLAQTTTTTGGITYVGSVFLKKAVGSPDWMQVAYSTTGLGGFANFNLTSGTVGNVGAGCTGRIENYGNGWYRCTLVQTASVGGTSGGPVIVFTNNTNPTARYVSYLGSVATSIYAWGAQLETGQIATSYIPTVASGITRAADVITDTTASGVIGQTQGTIYAEFEHTSNTAERRLIALSDGTSTNRIFIWAINNILYAQIQGNSTIITNSIPSGYNKVAFAYQQNGVNGNLFTSINGGAVVSGTSTTYPSTLSRVALGNTENVGGTFQWNNRIRAAALYPTLLTNTELALLTSPYTSYSSMASALSYTLG
jgi:hypothetical protein